MKYLLTGLSVLAGLASTALASAGTKAFERAHNKGPVFEKRHPGKPFESPRLQKRASPYLTNKTQSMRAHFPSFLPSNC